MRIFCFSPFGYEGSLVSIEVDLRRGIPAVDIVGLADGAVKESRERMRSAIMNSGLEFPPERILISLSPADLKKEGAGFDLAVALAVLEARKDSPVEGDVLVMGELELNGVIRPVRGIHAAASTAFSCGITRCIVPEKNAEEARSVCGMKVFGAKNLVDAFGATDSIDCFSALEDKFGEPGENGLPSDCVDVDGVLFPAVCDEMDYRYVKNQSKLVRALQIAAAGGHNLLAFGPPGCGKTLSLQKFPSLLPLLEMDKSQSVTRIHSLAGLLGADRSLIRTRPFRMPHQTATIEGMCGGGHHCLPGEISLSHNGVLFLDEAAEFKTSVLQMLRVPLENGSVTLSRAGRSTVFPADFQLLLSTNPCPCGNYGSSEKICLCSARAVEQYWRKFSGPLLDRIDLRVQVDGVNASGSGRRIPDGKDGEENGISTEELRHEIASAVRIQRSRQDKCNARLSPSEVQQFCVLSEGASKVLESAEMKYSLSQRAVSGCKKLARTICDMKGIETIDEDSMKEAVSFRSPSGAMEMLA